MKKLPYIRQGQQLTIDILNGIIKAINSSILERKEYDSMMADITRMFNSYQSKVDNFILKYQDVVDNTPGLMDLLQSYSTLASMVNGTYVASVGSVNITAAGFNIQGTMGRVQFEDERNYARTYPQYSSLLITEFTGATTLVYNVAPFENTPIWIEMNAIVGPQGPPGREGIQGPSGKDGEDGKDGQITSIKGKVASLDECLELQQAPISGDAYVADNGDDGITLYVYFDEDLAHTDPNSWVALNNIRGPAGPQGEMAEIRIQYSNYADGSNPSDVYNAHSFMIISEDGGSTRHVIKLTPRVEFRIVDIVESTIAQTPSTDVSRTYYPESNETIINTKITIPYLRTVESASLVGDTLHLKYRGIEETTPVGRVVFDPAKIFFTDGISGLDTNTLKERDVIIDVSDNYKIYNYIGGEFVVQGALQGPPGPAGPVGASFNLIGNWVNYGEVEASAGNVGNAYFLPADDGNHALGLYVSSETSPGVYGWVFAGNSQGPQGETGATGATGPRGTRITAGEDFYFNEEDILIVPVNTSNTYKQHDLYLNTTSWDLFQVTEIGPTPSYAISAVLIGNIKGLGITNITVDDAAENLTVTYSGGSTTVVPIRTIRVADTEYDKAGLVVHKTDTSAKGIFEVDNAIGVQSDPEDPDTFNIWGDATLLQKPGTASAGISTLIPRADHVHPAQTAITGNAGSATKLQTARTIGLSGVTATAQSFDGTGAITIPISAIPASIITQDASKRFVTETEKSTWSGKASTATASTSANGLMSSTDKSKLDGIADNANNYTHPSNHPASMITQDASNRFVTDAEKSGWNNKAEKAYVDSRLAPYDKVIRTQAEFDALIASATWLDAKSVAFVGAFTLSTANNSGVKIPATVKQIHGFNSAKITVTNFLYNSSTAKGGLWYATAPTTLDYSIRDLEVSCTGSSTGTNGSGFYNCINLSNCTGTGTGKNGYGFLYCDNLSNCTGTGTGGTSYGENGHGFAYCDNLSNCTGTGTGTTGSGFYHCINLSNCTGTGAGEGNGYGFAYCDNLSNCTGSSTGGLSRGFSNCNNLSNCTGTGTGNTSGYGFYGCNNLSNCTGKGVDSTDASIGFGFSGINYAVNCKDGGSSTDMWTGTNKNIDTLTCHKTVSETSNSTLNA